MAADYEGVAVAGEEKLGQKRHWGEWGELGVEWSGEGLRMDLIG